MCNTSLHHRAFNNVMEPFPFSTFHLLRTCNRLMLPAATAAADAQSYYNFVKETNCNSVLPLGNPNDYATAIPSTHSPKSPILDVSDSMPLTHETNEPPDVQTSLVDYEDSELNDTTSGAPLTQLAAAAADNDTSTHRDGIPASLFRSSISGAPKLPSLPAFEYIAPASHAMQSMATDFPLMELNRIGGGVFPAFIHRRPRGEKRPIPDEQKDEKYFERRKRNNEAAKKSRDARKIREDRIAFRAALLEQENSILKAQVMALRDELQTMRQLISTTSTAGRSGG